MIRHRCF